MLASELRTQFQWSNAQYAYIAVAFNLGMMCGQVPAGSLMDRVGARVGLAAIFVAWSLITRRCTRWPGRGRSSKPSPARSSP